MKLLGVNMNFQASVNKKVCAEPISRVLKFRRFVQGVPSCLQHLCMEVEAAANAADKDSLRWCLPHPAPIPAFEQPRPNRLKQLSQARAHSADPRCRAPAHPPPIHVVARPRTLRRSPLSRARAPYAG